MKYFSKLVIIFRVRPVKDVFVDALAPFIRGRACWKGFLLLIVMSSWPGIIQAALVDDVIAAAKKEGVIQFYAPSTLTLQGAQAIAAGVNKKYGLNIKMNYSQATNMLGDVAKVVGHAEGGAPPQWDLMCTTDVHQGPLWQRKLLQVFDYRSLGAHLKAIIYDGGAVSFANQFVLPAYNNKLVAAKDVPQSWEDLLDPKWKGKLGVTSATHHMARLAVGAWGEEKATNFVKALAKQNPILGQIGQIQSRMLLGEVLVAASYIDGYIRRGAEKGAPIVFADKVSPVVAPANIAGVPKGAKNPHVAYLFAAFLTTPEGQNIWGKTGETSAFIPGTAAFKFAQGKKLVIMKQEQAETVSKLAIEYGKILGFGGL